MSEKTKCNKILRDSIKEWNKTNRTRIEFERIENRCIPGMPDIHLSCSNGKELWIESKYKADFPNKIDLRPEQVIWHTKHWRLVRNCFVILRTKFEFHVWNGCLAKYISNGEHLNYCLNYKSDKNSIFKLISDLVYE